MTEAREFRCALCGETYEHVTDGTWTEEEALAEFAEQFPGTGEEDRETVCDDCYRGMGLPWSCN